MAPASSFGDVFLYQGGDYVFFAEDIENGIVYAGRVLDNEMTGNLIRVEKIKNRQGVDLHNSPIFSYVILGTKEFEKRAANCGSSELNSSGKFKDCLNVEDIENMKQEIEVGPAPKALKDLVRLLS